MLLTKQDQKCARNVVLQLQVCNKANCLSYPFCSYHRDKNHAPKAGKGLPPARASFLMNSICSHSFPQKFANLVFRFVAISGALGNLKEKGWGAWSRLGGVKCSINFELYTNLEPQPEIWKFDQKESMLHLPEELKSHVVFTSGTEMSPQVNFDPRASVHRMTYESKWMNPTSKRATMVYVTWIPYEQLYNFLIYPKLWEINFKSWTDLYQYFS